MGKKWADNLGAPDWPSTPGGTSAIYPEGRASLTRIDKIYILGDPDRQTTLVGNIPNENNWQPSSMVTDSTVAKEWKSSTVGQITPDWRSHTEKRVKQRGAPHPPGRKWPGLKPPQHNTGGPVTCATTNLHIRGNKQRQRKLQEEQGPKSYWQTHERKSEIPQHRPPPGHHWNKMCPSRMELHHPAYAKLL